jgi:hypothetical protein
MNATVSLENMILLQRMKHMLLAFSFFLVRSPFPRLWTVVLATGKAITISVLKQGLLRDIT